MVLEKQKKKSPWFRCGSSLATLTINDGYENEVLSIHRSSTTHWRDGEECTYFSSFSPSFYSRVVCGCRFSLLFFPPCRLSATFSQSGICRRRYRHHHVCLITFALSANETKKRREAKRQPKKQSGKVYDSDAEKQEDCCSFYRWAKSRNNIHDGNACSFFSISLSLCVARSLARASSSSFASQKPHAPAARRERRDAKRKTTKRRKTNYSLVSHPETTEASFSPYVGDHVKAEKRKARLFSVDDLFFEAPMIIFHWQRMKHQ